MWVWLADVYHNSSLCEKCLLHPIKTTIFALLNQIFGTRVLLYISWLQCLRLSKFKVESPRSNLRGRSLSTVTYCISEHSFFFGIVSSAVKPLFSTRHYILFLQKRGENIFDSTRFSIFCPFLGGDFLSRRTWAMEAGNTISVLKIKLEVIFLCNSISPNFRLQKVCFIIIFLLVSSECRSGVTIQILPLAPQQATCCPQTAAGILSVWALFLAAAVGFSSGSAACLSAAQKGNSKGTKLCFSWETTPFGMERYGLPLLFCFPLQSKQQPCKDQGQQEKNII